MMLKKYFPLLFFALAQTLGAAQPFESKTTLFTGQSYGGYYTESVFSAIDSHDGAIYFVMIDQNRKPFVGKIDSAGNTTIEPLAKDYEDYVTRDDGHHELSIGIDKEGYIHIAGDMHNHPQLDVNHLVGDAEVLQDSDILYWKSDAPGDISHFSFMGFDNTKRIPGKAFSYGHFFTDRNGELYYSARTLARTWYHQKAHQGGVGRGLGLYRYNVSTESWTARGVLADMYSFSDANYPVIVYDSSGHGGNSSYQQYKGDFYFDKNNRMHMALGMNTEGHAGVNNVIYAYSDDGGITFHKANGDNIQLPMTAAPGSRQADIIRYMPSSPANMDQASVVSAWNNFPVVHYKQGGGKYKYWTGTSWSNELDAPTSPRDEILFNEHTNELLFIDINSGNIFAKSTPTGNNQTYDAGPKFQYYDIKTFRSQNILNGISWQSSGGSGTFEVIQLVGENVGPPLDCNFEPGGTAFIDTCGVCAGGSTGKVPNECSQDPFNGDPHPVPGTIELEEFDLGPNGIAYFDDSPGNTGTEFRMSDVDIEEAESTPGSYNIGWVENGEWLEYTIDVATTGSYDFIFKVASADGGTGFEVEIDATSLIPLTAVPITGGWQTYDLITINNVDLDAGEHVMKLSFFDSGMNFDKVDITLVTGATAQQTHSLNLYPNPVNGGVLHLDYPGAELSNWKLINAQGAQVQSGFFKGNLAHKISVQDHEPGIYQLILSSHEIQESHKILLLD